MKFTIGAYEQLLELLRCNGYNFCLYQENEQQRKTVILRHDIDFSIEKALDMGKVETRLGIKSTYFILLSTDFYNIFSKQSHEKLKQIMLQGHEIGLHFDEKRYDINTAEDMKQHVEFETDILSQLLDRKIKVISMHRPSKIILENDLEFEHLINSYSSKYFKEMKYLSDSRMHWRENPIEVIESDRYQKLHILTHPFWYSNELETMEWKMKSFLHESIYERYDNIHENFRDFEQVIDRKEINR